MITQKMNALVQVELKKLYRDPMSLAVMLLMPVGLTLIFFFALGNVANDYYPVPGMNHFEYILPGVMGYAVIYMGMMVALALCEYRKSGMLKRVEAAPVSASAYLGSHIIANMIIATIQGLIVLVVVCTCRLVLLSSMSSWSMSVICPIPERAADSAAQEPTPPTPTMPRPPMKA